MLFTTKQPAGLTAFTLIWAGQVISLLGSAMTWFAFTIWAWQKTGQASTLAMVSFFAFVPTLLFTPIAGVLVDRWNRKLLMLLSDAATALGTFIALLLLLTNTLQIWHIYIIGMLAGLFTAFQYPAYAASISTMLTKEQYMRAEGMMGLAYTLPGILAPVIAAMLLARIGLAGIMVIDLTTFLAAFATLIWANIPQTKATAVGLASRAKIWRETLFGFQYIRQHPPLIATLGLFVIANFFLAIGATLMAPFILSQNGGSETALATVQSMGGVGGVIGGGLLMVWGGPKRRIHAVLLGGAGACSLGIIWLGLANSLWLWAMGSFFFSFFEPFVEGSNLAIWQTKVEADVQGRVLATRHLLVQIPFLFGILVAGPLADFGIAPVLVTAGLCGTGAFLAGYLFKQIRQIESLLPDQIHGS